MKKLKVTDVFTPNTSSPTKSKVSRGALMKTLNDEVSKGGAFVFVQGVTKLGKTTLVRDAVCEPDEDCDSGVDLHFWFESQNLRGGPDDLWKALAAQLRHPIEKALATKETNTSKWGWIGSLGFVRSSVGNDHAYSFEKSEVQAVDLPHAIPEALKELRNSGLSIAIVLDDFHFIEDEGVRTEILQALKPVADKKVTILVVTLPYRDNFYVVTTSNIGGRSVVLEVPTWCPDDLAEIADTGFRELKVFATAEVTHQLALNSFGSPQIMQGLCLELCWNNTVRKEQDALTKLRLPTKTDDLYKKLNDENAKSWLERIGRGAKTRGRKRKFYEIYEDGNPITLDIYTLVLHALKNLGPQSRTTLNELKVEIGRLRQVEPPSVNRMNLGQALSAMSLLALKDMQATLKEVDESKIKYEDELTATDEIHPEDIFEDSAARSVPQPVFEWNKNEATSPINILDPLLLYTLKWHWLDVFEVLRAENSGTDAEHLVEEGTVNAALSA